jgi:hypothetical protein
MELINCPDLHKRYDYIGKKNGGLRRVKKGIGNFLKCGYVNYNFEEVIPLIFSGAGDFKNGLAIVRIGNWAIGKVGYIDSSGGWVIEPLFDKAFPFSDGMAKVVINKEWYFIDLSGEKKIPLKDYYSSSSFHEGYAIVIKKENPKASYPCIYGIIDKTGKEVVPCNYLPLDSTGYPNCYKLSKWVEDFMAGKLKQSLLFHSFDSNANK